MPPPPCPFPLTAPPQAVLWDFDGTLADTEPLWIAAEFEVIEGELGKPWSMEHAEKLVGSDLIDSASYILTTIGRTDLAADLDGAAAARPGGGAAPHRRRAALAARCPRAARGPASHRDARARWCRRPTGCCSTPCSSGLPEGSFAVSVGGDEVTLGKPHPEPYEKACALLGVDAAGLRGAGGLRHRRPVRQRGGCRGGRDPARGGHPGGAAARHRTDPRRSGPRPADALFAQAGSAA